MADILLVAAIVIVAIVFLYIGFIIGKKIADHRWEDELPDIRAQAAKQSRSVLSGQFSEQLAPYLPDFPYSPTEAKFLGKPIDFLVFKGMDEKAISEVVFVEVKSGKSALNAQERNLKEAIQNKRVSWHEYKIPQDLTRKKSE